MTVARVLPSEPLRSLATYTDAGGGRALGAMRRLGTAGVMEDLHAAGLRGRGGAGFPTARKWAAVRERTSALLPSTVVVNGAEGEPGSFKDRTILRANPFAVIEGALVGAWCVGADRVVIALRGSFTRERDIVEQVIRDAHRADWFDEITVEVFTTPEEYLVGEETGLLEVLDGRPPFPRVQPPFRYGVDEVPENAAGEPAMAAPGGGTGAPPTLVSNVETFANVPGIVAEGPAWFRSLGTDASPGTVVCTVSGDTARAGVGEFAMGTPLRDIVDELGDGMPDGRGVAAVMSGVANPLVPGDMLGTPATHEALRAIGSGLGAAGFIVFDDETDFTAVAEGVARFLSVESCGQCTPCKQDGRRIRELLGELDRGEHEPDAHGDALVLLDLDARIRDVADSARCGLAEQHQRVVGSIASLWYTQWREHAHGIRPPVDATVIAPIVDIVDGRAVIDPQDAQKQPDWTFDAVDSGEAPADRYGDGRPHPYPPVRPRSEAPTRRRRR